MRADLVAAALRALADAIEAEPPPPPKRPRGRPRKPPPVVTSSDEKTLEQMGVRLGGSKQ